MRLLYSAIFYLLLPLIVARMLWRSRLAPDYRRRLGERFGFFHLPPQWQDERPWLWLHSVSVGETLAAAPLVEELLARYPGYKLLVTTTTPTGSAQVNQLFGDRVFHVYAPWDLPGATARFCRRLSPQLLILMETELWPNTLHYCVANGGRVLLANARLSERSARGYQRFAALTRQMLDNLDRVACQADADGERFVALGLPRDRLEITGSIKFDLELNDDLRQAAAALRQDWQADDRLVLVAASTHPGEEQLILDALQLLLTEFPDLLLVLVPRHPERFDSVAGYCAERGLATLRRSAGESPEREHQVLLGDTMGELLLLLSTARLALVGGSLVPHGGHNMLEAAAWGVPVITGPYVFNFSEISGLMVTEGAMECLQDSAQLATALRLLLGDGQRLDAMGRAGLEVVRANRGARHRLLGLIEEQRALGDTGRR